MCELDRGSNPIPPQKTAYGPGPIPPPATLFYLDGARADIDVFCHHLLQSG